MVLFLGGRSAASDVTWRELRKPVNANRHDESGNLEGPSMSTTPPDLSRVTTEPGTANYALGHSPTEIRRLGIQAAIRPITMRLLRSLGVSPGMRILDVGLRGGRRRIACH